MIKYEEIKKWFSEKENKQKVVIGVCFVVIFLIGFGVGNYDKNRTKNKLPTNYTTFQPKKPAPVASKEGEDVTPNPVVKKATTTLDSACIIKGNISSSGKKIYHMQGGAFYKKVKPEQCFTTEGEAKTAGFIKSSR
jgi:predicted proteasome-type protease